MTDGRNHAPNSPCTRSVPDIPIARDPTVASAAHEREVRHHQRVAQVQPRHPVDEHDPRGHHRRDDHRAEPRRARRHDEQPPVEEQQQREDAGDHRLLDVEALEQVGRGREHQQRDRRPVRRALSLRDAPAEEQQEHPEQRGRPRRERDHVADQDGVDDRQARTQLRRERGDDVEHAGERHGAAEQAGAGARRHRTSPAARGLAEAARRDVHLGSIADLAGRARESARSHISSKGAKPSVTCVAGSPPAGAPASAGRPGRAPATDRRHRRGRRGHARSRQQDAGHGRRRSAASTGSPSGSARTPAPGALRGSGACGSSAPRS